jgi:hypothetical protein
MVVGTLSAKPHSSNLIRSSNEGADEKGSLAVAAADARYIRFAARPNASFSVGPTCASAGGKWIDELWQQCRGLKRKELKPREWQDQIESLLKRVSFEEILSVTNLEQVSRTLVLPEGKPGAADIELPGLQGLTSAQVITSVFGLRQGRAIVPHGHHNMASIHLVLTGKFHVRHFERVRDEPITLFSVPPSMPFWSRASARAYRMSATTFIGW